MGDRTVLAYALGLALLAGCAQTSDPAARVDLEPSAGSSEATPSPSGSAKPKKAVSGGPGIYRFRHKGAVITVEVPTSADDPRVADLEAARRQADADPSGYFAVKIDNTKGTADLDIYELVVRTTYGQFVAEDGAAGVLRHWRTGQSDEATLPFAGRGQVARDVFVGPPLEGRPLEVGVVVDSTAEHWTKKPWKRF